MRVYIESNDKETALKYYWGVIACTLGRSGDDDSVLLIDDECDYASVNTKKTKRDSSGEIKDDWDPSATNKLIRELLQRFEKKVYLIFNSFLFL